MNIYTRFFCIALFLVGGPVFAQELPTTTTLPAIFIDCDFCDRAYQRNELDFLNHVRDQSDADIYVLITSQRTASGGRSYSLAFEGKNTFEEINFDLSHISDQYETDDDRRAGLTQVIRMGVLTYISQTPFANQFDINFEEGENARVGLGQDDPWNNWVFSTFLSTDFQAEKRQDEFGFFGSFNVNRITEAFKFEADIDVELDRESFENNNTTIKNSQEEIDGDLELVKSLSDKWSVGAFVGYRSTTFQNLKSRFNISPAIEYNVYPWSEADRREITFAYFINLQNATYFEETIFDKTTETLVSQSIRIGAQFEQPWGEVFAQLFGSHFLHDPSKYRVEFFGNVDVRITRGLSLFLRGDVELIHDQLFLPRGDATLEEILLRQRQLSTNFQVSGRIGFRFTFGSIYNNVVNPRL